ncbi:hypothetical protein FNH22_22675 [Fulvivirga sp. M361]|uniref:hypothetical protein n=1 Tax=Fulvivirga sp. M361 TaxID=2594266 RepID=UPI00117A32EF|nr:hypothetical protein [Fulvivirga sp. M361]TRX52225.1 hypothetical protein FNH22_22675 [Fulvivirga sp. M361]
MKRKTLVKIHVIATIVAMLTISTFFALSLAAELRGDPDLIKTVKRGILYALPLLIIAMPTLAITGNQLARNSKNPKVIEKKLRMKFVMINGIVLISLVVFLYYQSHFKVINTTFLIAQIAEFIFGLGNLTLIGLSARTGLMLSDKLRSEKNT